MHPTREIKKYEIQSVMKNTYNCLSTSVRDRADHFVRHLLDDIHSSGLKKILKKSVFRNVDRNPYFRECSVRDLYDFP